MSAPRDLDVAVVGAGSFGTALASTLATAERSLALVTRREEQAEEINSRHTNSRYLGDTELPEALRATTDLQGAVRRAAVVLVVVPSKAMRQTARAIGDVLEGDQYVVHATKGFEQSTYLRMSEVLRQETCALKLGVLAGPNLAAEVLSGQPAGAVVASRFHEVVEACQALFAGSWFRVYGSRDVVGTEIAGAFKNIIAIAAGMAEGMGFGDNTKSLLVTRGLAEMAQVGMAMGAGVLSFGGLAGIGDLMATCNSHLSRNHQVGARVARGETLEQILASMAQVAEGVATTEIIRTFAAQYRLDLPIVDAVAGILAGEQETGHALLELMRRPVGDELVQVRTSHG